MGLSVFDGYLMEFQDVLQEADGLLWWRSLMFIGQTDLVSLSLMGLIDLKSSELTK